MVVLFPKQGKPFHITYSIKVYRYCITETSFCLRSLVGATSYGNESITRLLRTNSVAISVIPKRHRHLVVIKVLKKV